MRFGCATAITTPRWRLQSTCWQAVITSSVSIRPTCEIDNLRAAFVWSRENSDVELALALASSLQALWLARGRVREGLTWFDPAH